ncbi:hypothetical protein BU17DRAFT_90698 [Hysterangium stoloniferum]|nr:hypothetical protein BU17DRAFT_90698 [Hysterangium stoloniferum]
MSSKIVSPFAGSLTANSLKVWLGSCEDGFENYEDTHDKKLVPKTHICLTGAALTEPQMVEWWALGKVEFLALPSWESFVKKVKDRFMPVNWKMDALEQFYSCSQGKCDFRTFAMDLAQCLGTLPSATISTAIYKHHILFYSHPLLYLRMHALQAFDIDNSSQTPDELIALMRSQWDSLVADNAARSGCSSAHINHTSSTGVPLLTSSTGNSTSPTSLITPPKFLPITEEEKAALTAVRGCWNCCGKPMDPGWVPHQRHTCPGNPTIGAHPGKDFNPLTVMSTTPTPVPTTTTTTAAAVILQESPYGAYEYPAHSGSMTIRCSSPSVREEDTDSELGLDN